MALPRFDDTLGPVCCFCPLMLQQRHRFTSPIGRGVPSLRRFRRIPERLLNALQSLLIRIEPVKAVDLAEAEPHRAIFSARCFQRIVSETEGDIDLAHFHIILARVADDLRRGIKAHRLRIE